jgi:hypothetical protein
MGSSRTTPLARRRRTLLGGAPTGPLRTALQLGTGRKGSRVRVKRPSWKLVGLAGIAGVAATGVVVARSRRTHRDLPPDELRERLHRRLAEVGADGESAAPAQAK